MLLLRRVTALFVLLFATLTFSGDMQAAPLAQDASVRLSCRVEPAPLSLNGVATLVLEVENVQNLYGYELNMLYDVNLVQMQDADPNQSGSNLDLADKFLSPDYVLKNAAESGNLSIVLTQLAPNQAKSGSGELARISFVGTAAGFANFAFGKVVFSDNNGMAIPLTAEDCLAEIGSSGAPTPTATATSTATSTPTSLPSPTATFSPTPEPTQVAGVNAEQPTATFTVIPPTALPTETPVAPPTATFTPVSQVTETSPTATFTPIPPTATETATPFVPPTATVLVISTPTPVSESPIGGEPRAQEQQPTLVPTESAPVPTATLSVVDNDALVADGASPTATSLPPTAQAFTDSGASSSPAVVSSATPTLAPEALSPPQMPQESPDPSMPETAVVPTESVPGEASTAAATVAQSSTPTPLVIAQVEARPLRAKIVVDQPQPVRPLIQGEVLRIGAWITLLCASLLVLFAWRLRKFLKK